MSWIEKRSYFDSRNSTLGEEQINDRVSKLKKAINNYIQNTDDKRNTHFQEIQRLMNIYNLFILDMDVDTSMENEI